MKYSLQVIIDKKDLLYMNKYVMFPINLFEQAFKRYGF